MGHQEISVSNTPVLNFHILGNTFVDHLAKMVTEETSSSFSSLHDRYVRHCRKQIQMMLVTQQFVAEVAKVFSAAWKEHRRNDVNQQQGDGMLERVNSLQQWPVGTVDSISMAGFLFHDYLHHGLVEMVVHIAVAYTTAARGPRYNVLGAVCELPSYHWFEESYEHCQAWSEQRLQV